MMIETSVFPSRTIHDSSGKLEGIILDYREYQLLLRLLAHYADWEELPRFLQDAIDHMLANEARNEEGATARPFTEVLAELGESIT
jgi:hypothetical protein